MHRPADDDGRDKRARLPWSIAGALSLAALGALSFATSLEVEAPILLFIGTGQVIIALNLLRWAWRRRLEGTWLHAAGIALAGLSVILGLFDPTLVLEVWAVPTLGLGIAAVVALAIGRS
jgi:hypothetical protein